jgi:uncharacterized membrane protein
MTATLAPSPWPAPASPPPGRPWRFGRELQLEDPQGKRHAMQWLMKRNCSITPRQLGSVYAGLCALSLSLALLFVWQGAPYVMGFTSLEMLLLGVAMLVHARHAGDRETITLSGGTVVVEQDHGRRLERTEFRADWLAVEPAGGQGSLVELSSRGQCVRVGRHLRPELRASLAQELRLALRRGRPGAHDPLTQTEPRPR